MWACVQAGLALYYIIGGEEPEAEWRQACLDAGANERWLDGIQHRIRPPEQVDKLNARFREQFAIRALLDKAPVQHDVLR